MMGVAEAMLRVRDQASAPLRNITDAARDTEQALDRAATAGDQASGRIGRFGDAAGAVGGAAGKLAGGLDLLVPGLGDVARNLADMADVGEVAAGAAGGLSGVLTTLTAMMAPLALGLGLVTTAYAVVGNAMTTDAELARQSAAAYVEANAAAAALAGTLDTLATAQRATADAMAAAQEQIALMTGATTSYEVAASKASQGVRDAAAGELDVLRERLRLQMAGLSAAQQVLSAEASTAEQKAEATRQEALYQRQVGQTRLAINSLKAATEEQAGVLEGLVLAEGLAREERERAAKSTAAAATAERARAEALRQTAEAAERTRAAEAKARAEAMEAASQQFEGAYGARDNPQVQFLTEFYAALDQARSKRDLQLLVADLAVAMTRFGLSAEQAAAAQEALNAAIEATPEAPAAGSAAGSAAAGAATSGGQRASTAIGAATSLTGLAAADPTGIAGAVVAGLQAVSGFQAGGANVLTQVNDLVSGAAKGLEQLGPVLTGFVGGFLQDALPSLIDGAASAVESLSGSIPEIVQGAADAVPALVKSALSSLDELLIGAIRISLLGIPTLLIEATKVLLSVDFWKEMGRALVDALLDLINPFTNSDKTGLFQEKGFFARTETAVRDVFDGRGGRGRGGDTHIYNGVIADRIENFQRQVREARRRGVEG